MLLSSQDSFAQAGLDLSASPPSCPATAVPPQSRSSTPRSIGSLLKVHGTNMTAAPPLEACESSTDPLSTNLTLDTLRNLHQRLQQVYEQQQQQPQNQDHRQSPTPSHLAQSLSSPSREKEKVSSTSQVPDLHSSPHLSHHSSQEQVGSHRGSGESIEGEDSGPIDDDAMDQSNDNDSLSYDQDSTSADEQRSQLLMEARAAKEKASREYHEAIQKLRMAREREEAILFEHEMRAIKSQRNLNGNRLQQLELRSGRRAASEGVQGWIKGNHFVSLNDHASVPLGQQPTQESHRSMRSSSERPMFPDSTSHTSPRLPLIIPPRPLAPLTSIPETRTKEARSITPQRTGDMLSSEGHGSIISEELGFLHDFQVWQQQQRRQKQQQQQQQRQSPTRPHLQPRSPILKIKTEEFDLSQRWRSTLQQQPGTVRGTRTSPLKSDSEDSIKDMDEEMSILKSKKEECYYERYEEIEVPIHEVSSTDSLSKADSTERETTALNQATVMEGVVDGPQRSSPISSGATEPLTKHEGPVSSTGSRSQPLSPPPASRPRSPTPPRKQRSALQRPTHRLHRPYPMKRPTRARSFSQEPSIISNGRHGPPEMRSLPVQGSSSSSQPTAHPSTIHQQQQQQQQQQHPENQHGPRTHSSSRHRRPHTQGHGPSYWSPSSHAPGFIPIDPHHHHHHHHHPDHPSSSSRPFDIGVGQCLCATHGWACSSSKPYQIVYYTHIERVDRYYHLPPSQQQWSSPPAPPPHDEPMVDHTESELEEHVHHHYYHSHHYPRRGMASEAHPEVPRSSPSPSTQQP